MYLSYLSSSLILSVLRNEVEYCWYFPLKKFKLINKHEFKSKYWTLTNFPILFSEIWKIFPNGILYPFPTAYKNSIYTSKQFKTILSTYLLTYIHTYRTKKKCSLGQKNKTECVSTELKTGKCLKEGIIHCV